MAFLVAEVCISRHTEQMVCLQSPCLEQSKCHTDCERLKRCEPRDLDIIRNSHLKKQLSWLQGGCSGCSVFVSTKVAQLCFPGVLIAFCWIIWNKKKPLTALVWQLRNFAEITSTNSVNMGEAYLRNWETSSSSSSNILLRYKALAQFEGLQFPCSSLKH